MWVVKFTFSSLSMAYLEKSFLTFWSRIIWFDDRVNCRLDDFIREHISFFVSSIISLKEAEAFTKVKKKLKHRRRYRNGNYSLQPYSSFFNKQNIIREIYAIKSDTAAAAAKKNQRNTE